MALEQDVTLVCLFRVNPAKLPRGLTLRELPDALGSYGEHLLESALVADKHYVVRDYETVRWVVNKHAEPFDSVAPPAEPPSAQDEPSQEARVIPLFGGGRAPAPH